MVMTRNGFLKAGADAPSNRVRLALVGCREKGRGAAASSWCPPWIRKCSVLLSVTLLVSAGWATWNDDLPETFDTTAGYVTQTGNDSFSAPVPCDTDFNLARHWSDGQIPHAGAKYYSNYNLYTPFYVTNSSIAFAGDTLVVGKYFHLLTGSVNSTVDYDLTIPDFVLLGGAQVASYGVKHALAGNLRIRRSSAASPVSFRFMTASTFLYPIHASLDGDARQTVVCTNTGSGVVTYSFDGDLSNYKGLFRATQVGRLALKNPAGGLAARVHVGAKSQLAAADSGDLSLPELTAETGADLVVAAGKTFIVGDLNLAAGVSLDLAYDKASHACGRLVVTNTFARTGILDVNIASYEESDENYEIELIRWAPEVDRSQISSTAFRFLQAEKQVHTWMEMRTNDDGGLSLILKSYPLVRHTSATFSNSSKISDFNTATNASGSALWSNASAPLLDEDVAETVYLSNYTTVLPTQKASEASVVDLPMKSLFLDAGGSLWSFNRLYGVRVNLTMNGSFIQTANSGVQDPLFKALDGKTLNTLRLQGTLNLVSGTTSQLVPYGGAMFLRTESELRGGGDLRLSTYRNAGSYLSNAGYHELTGTNVDWTGLLTVSSVYETSKYASSGIVTPNDDVCVRLFVSDGRNLGGARETFAYNALHLEHHAILVARNSFTLDDGLNRGVSIGDRGRILVPEGASVVLARPLTLNGNLVKEGPGLLVLGGRLNFLDGSTLTGTPVEGSNLVTVAEGSLSVSSTNALDGARIIMGANAKLHVSPDAAETVRTYGICNLKTNGAFESEAANGLIAVETSLPSTSSENPYHFTVAVCTVPADSALTAGAFTGIPPALNYEVSFSSADRDDGTKTIYMNVRRGGLTVIVR